MDKKTFLRSSGFMLLTVITLFYFSAGFIYGFVPMDDYYTPGIVGVFLIGFVVGGIGYVTLYKAVKYIDDFRSDSAKKAPKNERTSTK